MESSSRISTLEELEKYIRNHGAATAVTEVRVSSTCNERIMQHDGQGVNGMYIDAIAVVVDADQQQDVQYIRQTGK